MARPKRLGDPKPLSRNLDSSIRGQVDAAAKRAFRNTPGFRGNFNQRREDHSNKIGNFGARFPNAKKTVDAIRRHVALEIIGTGRLTKFETTNDKAREALHLIEKEKTAEWKALNKMSRAHGIEFLYDDWLVFFKKMVK